MAGIKLGDGTNCDIQVIDFGAFIDGSNRQNVADALFTSFKDTGFVYLANHSLPKDKIDEMFRWVRRDILIVWVDNSLTTIQEQEIFRPSSGNKATRAPSTHRSAS